MSKFYPTNQAGTHGYTIEVIDGRHTVVYAQKTSDGKFNRLGIARARGKTLAFPSIFKADYAIRTEVLPLYAKKAA
jgi:hypothetical protein